MKAEINQKDLHSYELSWLCVKPMLISVRGQDVSPTDLDHDLQLRQQTEKIYASYQLAAQKAINAMNDWVRQHQEMFLEIKEDLK
ncbi:hypothetical protein [Paenibacillus sp. TC-CSREp1]|uniref:hypothetical protein n=1 Tax=Paenibacillus sp. TC-CSREp1 TaxID=3410089 RepID=UPI003CEC83BA